MSNCVTTVHCCQIE